MASRTRLSTFLLPTLFHLQKVLQHTDILGAAQHWSTSEPGCYARSISAEACFCASSSFPGMMHSEITAILFCAVYAKWQLLLRDTHAQKPLRRQVRDWPRHAPSPPPPPLPPPVRATAQSRIALDTDERDCSAADMLLAPGKRQTLVRMRSLRSGCTDLQHSCQTQSYPTAFSTT